MGRKMVVLGKKKLFWTFVALLGVVVPLMLVSYHIPVDDVAGQGGKMLTYSSEKEGFKFDYPQEWLLRTERDFSGGEIIESITFCSPDRKATGTVQVLKLTKPIPEYILESKERMAPGYDSLQLKEEKNDVRQGFVLSYKRGAGTSRTVSREYFFKKGEKVYRFSCNYPEADAKKYQKVFIEMVEGLILPEEEQKQNSLTKVFEFVKYGIISVS